MHTWWFKNSYTIKLHSNMFRWWPQPSSGKSNLTKQNTESWNTPKTSSSDSERGFGNEKTVCTCCSTLLDTWAKGRSSHILPRHYRDGRCRQFFLTKLLREMRPGVLPMTLKQSNRVLNVLVRHPIGRRNWNSKGPASKQCWYFFFGSQGLVRKEFIPEGKTVNA